MDRHAGIDDFRVILQGLDRIEKAVRDADGLDNLIRDVLDGVLETFDSDRVWLIPCDLDGGSFTVPIERTKPQYPGALAQGAEIPILPEMGALMKEALDSAEPLRFDPSSGRPLLQPISDAFSIRSQLLLAIHPKVGIPWIFGMHQCSHPRVWTETEVALFKLIGRRVADSLGNLLLLNDLRKREEELRRAKAAAESASHAKSSFLANMSHEIRTPLTSILGFAGLLAQCGPEEREDFEKAIVRNSEQLFQIVNNVLDLSKIEADRLDVEKIRFPLAPLLEDQKALFDFKVRKKGLSLRFEAAKHVPDEILSDPTRLKQILANVIGNAVKFTERGEVVVRCRLVPTVSADDEAILEFTVSDTGVGLTDEQRDRLFRPFSQGDSSVTRQFGGTGLGLALSRRLAQALGGDLVLTESRPGAGSTFTLTVAVGPQKDLFSLHGKKSKKSAAEAPEKTNRLRGLGILLVEDTEDNQYLLSRILTHYGVRLGLAVNGEEAVKKALAENYDVILMDIQMPLMDGIEATSQLRRKGYKKPIIALTAHALAGEREKALKEGFDDYITKPIDQNILLRKLNRIASPAGFEPASPP